MTKPYFITAMGAALVDCFVFCDEKQLGQWGLEKGAMHLISQQKRGEVLEGLRIEDSSAGGACANTITTLSRAGLKASFLGRCGGDVLGDVFLQDMASVGVFCPLPRKTSHQTGQCLVLITKDGERTMLTNLASAHMFSEDDIEEKHFDKTDLFFCEAYLWDKETTKKAVEKALDIAREKRRKNHIGFV